MHEPDVRNYLHHLFKDTHHISYISSHDDNRKIVDLNKQYENFLDLEKLLLIQEGRPYTMDWLVLTPLVHI